MDLKLLFSIKSVITFVLILGIIIAPAWLGKVLGISVRASGDVILYYLIASFTAISLMCWSNRAVPAQKQKNAALTLSVCDALTLVVILIVLGNTIPQTWGWVVVLLWFAAVAGYSYYRWFNRVVFDSVKAV